MFYNYGTRGVQFNDQTRLCNIACRRDCNNITRLIIYLPSNSIYILIYCITYLEFCHYVFFLHFLFGHYYPCTATTIIDIICKYILMRVTGYASCNVGKLLVYCFILCIIYYDLQFEIHHLLTYLLDNMCHIHPTLTFYMYVSIETASL